MNERRWAHSFLVSTRTPSCRSRRTSLRRLREEFLSLWEEYEVQETVASHYVFDFDKLDMLIQANQYEVGRSGWDA